ncbi:MAG: cytochrome P450 [SAR86 cluster bacterium]|jgi:cytochrome P450|nr:cytochrome P450 [SAR86 cluster bacterium]
MNIKSDIDLLSVKEMNDPSITANKLLNNDRAYFYDKYNPPFFIFSRYDDVNNSLLDSDTYLEGHGNGPNFQPAQGVISDAPHHTYIRKLIQHDFLAKQIQNLEPRLQEIVEMLLDKVTKKEVWDVHDDLSFPLPVIIICEILGIPTDDIDKFKKWADASVANMCSEDPLEYADQLNEMREYLLKQIHKKRRKSDSDLLSLIAHAKQEDKYLSDDESVGLATQIFVAGNETTTSLISNLIWRLLTIDNLWREFTEDKIDLDDAINESLRFDPPLLGLYKTTSRDVNLGGIIIPANTKVMMHYGAANRDPEVFQNPNEFNVHRKGKKILTFSVGIHVCIGRELAKLETRVTLIALRKRFPKLTLVNEGERVGPFMFWGRAKLPVKHLL